MRRREFLEGAAIFGVFSLNPLHLHGATVRQHFDVTKFGARGDGLTLDTQAIQSAIDAAFQAGGGIVIFPPGIFLTGSLMLKSHVELHIGSRTTVLGSASFSDYTRLNHWYALLLADGQEDIAVSGSGVIDGQGQLLVRDVIERAKAGTIKDPLTGYDHGPDGSNRPLLIEFRKCHRVKISDVNLRNSSGWVQHYLQCENLEIKGVQVRSNAYWNNDGIDITDCTKVRVADCDINSDDDGICLKSIDPSGGCEDVEISNCRVRSSASAFKCGTDSFGGFRKIFVHDLYVYDTYRSAIALECVDGGVLENVHVEHVYAPNTGNAVFLRLGHRNIHAPVGRLSDISIRSVKVEVPKGAPDVGYAYAGPPVRAPHNLFPSSLTGLPGHPLTNITLEDVEIVFAGGGIPNIAWAPWNALDQVPERSGDSPEFSMFGELPAWGYYVRHAESISFRNCSLTLKERDYRPAMVLDDVRKVSLKNMNMGPMSGEPVIVLNNTKLATLQGIQFPENVPKQDRIRVLTDSHTEIDR